MRTMLIIAHIYLAASFLAIFINPIVWLILIFLSVVWFASAIYVERCKR